MKAAGSPEARKASHMNAWSSDGNAARKSKRMMAPLLLSKLIFWAAQSISMMFLNIGRSGRKPRCMLEILCATHLSNATRNIDASNRFEASTMDMGLVFSAV